MTALLVGCSAVLLVWFALRPLKERDLKLWARAYSLTLTAENGPLVVGYLQRAQRWRRLGFAFGYVVVTPLISWAGQGDLDAPFLLVILPYSAGIVFAEVFQRRRPPTGAADLDPRTLDQYLPRRLVWIPRLVLVTVVLATSWSMTIEVPGRAGWTLDRPAVATYLAVGVVLQIIGELAQRAIVRRRQPAAGPDVVAADDAMRSQSLHAIAGGLIGVQGSLLLPALARPAAANVLNPAFDTLIVLGPVIGWLVGIWYQNRAWRVRRAPSSASTTLGAPA